MFSLVLFAFCGTSLKAQVAKVNGTEYETLTAVLTAAKAMTGDVTVEIYDKVTLNQALTGSYSSIKFVGKAENAEIYLDIQGYSEAAGKKVAFENLKLSKVAGGYITNAGFMNLAFGVYGVTEATYTNCTFLNGAYASTGNVTFDGCTFYRSHDRYGLWAYGDVDITVDDCTFADIRGIKMYAEGGAKTVNLTVKNTDFTAADNKPAIVLTYGESVTLENNTYSSKGVFELDLDGAPNGTPVTSDVYPTCVNDNGACGVLVDGKIYTTAAQAAAVATKGSNVTLLHNSAETVEFAAGVKLNKNGFEAADVTVKVEGVAKIGETYYATLQAAYNAAKAGETIELLADVELASNLTIAKSITIDGKGHSIIADETATWYTMNGKVKNYKTHLLNLNADGITLKDIVLDNNSNAAGINVYCAQDVVFDNVSIINAIKGYAALTVNGSTVTAKTAFTALGNSVAIDISNGSGVTSTLGFTVEEGTVFDLGGKQVKFANVANNNMSGAVDAEGNSYFVAMDNAYYYNLVQMNSGTNAYSNGLTILADVTIKDKDLKIKGTLDINGKTLTFAEDKKLVASGDLTIKGNGTVDVKTITPGNYTISIYSGTYTIDVAEFCAENYASLPNLDGNYVVGENPTATVENLGSMVVEAGKYFVKNLQGSGDNSKDMPLQFVMQYTADQNAEQVAVSPYKEWYADFVLSFSGLANGSFVADENTYLAGFYGETEKWEGIWAKVGITGMEITEGTRYPVMLGVGMPQNYEYICAGVEEFLCAMNISSDILSANPNLKVTLELCLVDNSNDVAALNALETGGEKCNVVAKKEFTADDFAKVLEGEGTEEKPFLIKNLDDLVLFRNSVNAGETKYNAPGVYVALAADIDMEGIDWSVNIGDDCNATFDGIFDGQNHTISNLTSTETAEKTDGYICAGLFGAIYGDAVVKNFTIENVTINTDEFTGNNVSAVVGFAYNATGSIENVTVKGNININASKVTGVGAIVGYAYGSSMTVKDCEVIGNDNSVITGAAYVGGIIGYSTKDALNANTVNNVDINATSCAAGGVAGIMLAGGSAKDNTIENVNLKSEHDNWKNAAGIVVGSITGTVTISGTVYSDVNTDRIVGSAHADKPTTPVAKVEARIGDVYYTTYAKAYAAANAGETITLLADMTSSEIIVLDKAITLDGNGHTLTSTAARAINVSGANGVTIQNLTINASGERAINVIQNATNVTIDNVTATAANYTVNVASSAANAVVAINNSTLTGLNVVNVGAAGANVTIDNATINTVDNNSAEGYSSLCLNKDAKNGKIIATDVTINITGSACGDSSRATNQAEGGVISINGSIEGVDNDVAYISYGDNWYGFTTLEGAVAKAKDGETVVLIRDAAGAGVVINKSITIDFNGKTYSLTEGVGSTGTESNGFQILKGNNVTLKNGTLNVAAESKDKFYILVQNYANLNVENMTLDGTNLDKWSGTDGDSYVLSNNSGEVNIIKSKIIANNEGALAYAFDVCKDANYEAPVVTLDETSEIKGKVELSGGQFYPAQAVKVSLTKVVESYQVADNNEELKSGWYTISAPFAVDTTLTEGYELFRYNEATAMWENHKNTAHNSFGLEVGRGYLYAHANGADLNLEGKANIADYETTLSYTANEGHELEGFHLVGNPYTFSISGKHFSGNVADGFYTLANSGAWVVKQTADEITVGEGFLVQAKAETEFAINKTATATRNADNGSLQINVANAKYSDVAYVSFNEGIGLSKVSHQNANIPMVYVPVEGENYSIAYMSADVEEIPFAFEAKTMGSYTISVEAQNCEFETMTLVDRFTGVETNLLFEDYSFIAKSGDNSDRFIIRLSNETLNLEDENFVYINNNGLIIDNASSNATLQIFDVMGRPVASYNLSGSANISMESLTNGVYILRLMDENNVRVQKVVID